ncbi:hypothetical protein Pyrde_0214 [Pyrodictium delaneyi]|uniref:DUF711 domain-containing protein n=1 Tax=Pyrodictium delaneyi TaxID=1273541 RepID=A0A0P0N254_9CREN|nr:DUF711 family protein [Pyrodictium delaneyi]ALL00264.1 hypothetical protein Pyrde_0214 [Pyrodictium delaneyi]OWJ54342.1 hypothetical protein Pdsh_07625 [Pyrodictium delaneyi]
MLRRIFRPDNRYPQVHRRVTMDLAEMVKVRAIAVHVAIEQWDNRREIARLVEEASDIALELARVAEDQSGYEVMSTRVVLPITPLSPEEQLDLLKNMQLRDDVLYAAFHSSSTQVKIDVLEEVLKLGHNIYAAISGIADTGDKRTPRLLYKIGLLEPEMATRVAMAFGGYPESPYFPLGTTMSSLPGVSIALLYPRLLEEYSYYEAMDYVVEAAYQIYNAIRMEIEKHDLFFRGFDMSLSPWMDDSVARVVEKYSGRPMPGPGTAAAINRLEEFIYGVCSDIKCTGFNQVMLPVAEDNVLKERVQQGSLKLHDLVNYTYACVAGLDMVILPRNSWSIELAKTLIMEMERASRTKKKNLGLRVVTANAEPGTVVELPKFGPTPVISL